MAVNGLLLHALGIERFNSVSALLLILQLMSSGGILSEETSPGFYYVGRALPFYYGVRGLRTIFFGTQADSMYANWLVLFGWNVGTSLVSWVFVAHKIHNSGATARPRMAPMGTVRLRLCGWLWGRPQGRGPRGRPRGAGARTRHPACARVRLVASSSAG